MNQAEKEQYLREYALLKNEGKPFFPYAVAKDSIMAVLVMLVAAEPISAVVERHPTIKVLALSFLLLIGLSLVADGFGQHISKGYIYFAMGFSVFVEMINIRVRGRGEPLHLRKKYEAE